jgi:hypothetical protein
VTTLVTGSSWLFLSTPTKGPGPSLRYRRPNPHPNMPTGCRMPSVPIDSLDDARIALEHIPQDATHLLALLRSYIVGNTYLGSGFRVLNVLADVT